MKKWEYKSEPGKMRDADLNREGKEGWELVSHTAVTEGDDLNQYYIFKRELPDE